MMTIGLVAFGASALLVRLLITPAVVRMFLDHPNERSLHVRPVPRTGGLGVVASICCTLALFVSHTASLSLGALVLSAVSLIDDWRGLPAWVRLAAHLAAATAFLVLAVPGLSPLGFALLALATCWMINLYNFMDGMDGLAGGMGVVGFAAYGAAAWLGGDTTLATCSVAIAASVLGFLAAAVGVLGWHRGLWPFWFPVVVFAPFVIDASVTLLRRILRRERVWEAHLSHYYQRLVLMGWTHRRTVLFEYAIMLMGAAAGLLALRLDAHAQALALALLVVVYAMIMLAIDRRWRAEQEG